MGDGFAMGFGGGLMWLFWILIAGGVVWALKVLFAVGSDHNKKRKSAPDILEERYARGEIGREEFNEMNRDLQR